MVYLRICEKMRKSCINENTDACKTIGDSSHESSLLKTVWDKSWKTIEVFYFNQTEARIEIFSAIK